MRLSIRVWDLPVRLVHGLITLLLIAAVATAATHHPLWHIRLGETVLVLALWRITWGFFGSETARLQAFLVNPLAALRRRGPDDTFGHAASGGWLIVLMLLLLLALVFSGAIPRLHPWHFAVFVGLLLVIAAHLLVVLLAGLRGESPVRAMISGKKRMPAAQRAPTLAGLGLAALILFCAAGVVVLALNRMPF